MNKPRLLQTLEATAVLLFFTQSVRVLFSVLFGLIYDAIFDETLPLSTLGLFMLCVFVALLTPLGVPRRKRPPLLFATALVATLARVPLTINQPAVRFWSSILVIAAAGLYTATLVRQRPRLFPTALISALAVDQLLRAAGNTYDVSLRPWWLPVQAVLSLALAVLAWLSHSRAQTEARSEEYGIGLVGGLAVGALLFLETSLLGFPNALARWSGVDYAIVTPLLMVSTLLPLLPGVHGRGSRFLRGPLGRMTLLFLALAGLVAGKRSDGVIAALGLLLAQFLVLTAFLDTIVPIRRDRTGLALAVGLVLFLVLNFALAFAFTYPYMLPAFRDQGPSILLIAVVIACLPVLRRGSLTPETWNLQPWLIWTGAAVLIAVTVVLAWPPAYDAKLTGPIRTATYNMHYGYNTPWNLSLEAQARTIEDSGADIIVLQEVDTCRITSYGVDDLLWLGRRLGMQEVNGPALEGLSGIGLLTRLPIAEADTQLLTSHLEQTAIVHARVMVGDSPLHAYGIWLGLEPDERARQLDDALAYIGDASPAVFGGDFNSDPDSPIYSRIRAAGFDDPFILGGFDPVPTSPAIRPRSRIDFVWSRDLDIRDAQVLDSLASDHRLVVVELAQP